MRIELLYWDGCPSHPEALELLEEVLRAGGVSADVQVREVLTDADAETLRFPGSPTIRIAGRDVDPSGAGAPPSLNCRIYWRADGTASPVPTREQLEEAVLAAAATQAARKADSTREEDDGTQDARVPAGARAR